MLSEGGIRVQFVVSWPAGLPKGKTYTRPVTSLDVAATSVALAGLNPYDGSRLEAFSSFSNNWIKYKDKNEIKWIKRKGNAGSYWSKVNDSIT